MYLFIYVYISLLHSSQTQGEAKKKIYIYIYMYMCCRQNTVNFTRATKQLFAILTFVSGDAMGKHEIPFFFSLCILGQVNVYFFGLYINENDPE